MTEWVREQRWTKHQECLMLAIKSLLKDHEIRWQKESKCQSIQSPLEKKNWWEVDSPTPPLSLFVWLIFTFTPPVIFTSAHWQIRLVRCWTLQCTLQFLFGFHTILSFISLLILAKKALLLIPAEVHLPHTCNYTLTFLPSKSLKSGLSIYICLHTLVSLFKSTGNVISHKLKLKGSPT